MATKSTTSASVLGAASAEAAGSARKPVRTLAGTPPVVDDAKRKSSLAQYEAAIKLVHAGKFEKALEAFTKLLPEAPADIATSIRMYINACAAEVGKRSAEFSSNEERYDYAVSLLNQGHYEDAREHFEAIRGKDGEADYALYGLALLAAMTGDCNRCIEHLAEAIRLNPQNRLQARLDSDFAQVSDDPSFTELLYPEPEA